MGKMAAIALLLGASKYPNKPTLDHRSFAKSASGFATYLQSRLRLTSDHILNLFDVDLPPNKQIDSVMAFLSRHRPTGESDASGDLFVYYVGHGSFTRNRDYIVTITTTSEGNEDSSSLRLVDFANVIKREAKNRRKYIILDCCFAENAISAFQAPGVSEVVRQKTMKVLPNHGVSLLCASTAEEIAMAPRTQQRTMFSGAMLDVLIDGDPSIPNPFSFFELANAIESKLVDAYSDAAVRPSLSSPQKKEGDIAHLSLFPNFATSNGVKLNYPRNGKPGGVHPVLTKKREDTAAVTKRKREYLRKKTRLAVSAKSYSVYWQAAKEDKDVHCLDFAVQDLSVTKQKVSDYVFRLASSGGVITRLDLDKKSINDGCAWQNSSAQIRNLNDCVEARRHTDGRISLGQPIDKDSPPISFGWRVLFRNGFSTDSREFEIMYLPKDRTNVDQKPLTTPSEYFFVPIPYPLAQLTLRFRPPAGHPVQPRVQAWRLLRKADSDSLPVDKRGYLKGFLPFRAKWNLDRSLQQTLPALERKGRDWVLNAQYPPVDSGFSIVWDLPGMPLNPDVEILSREAQSIRGGLLRLAQDLRKKRVGSRLAMAVRTVLVRLFEQFEGTYRRRAHYDFDISLMTFNDVEKRIVVVEWLVNGTQLKSNLDLKLPIGVGNAGATYKSAETIVYRKPDLEDGNLDVYVKAGSIEHGALVSIPLDHPRFADVATNRKSSILREFRRWQLVGVINIGSEDPASPLIRLIRNKSGLRELVRLHAFCQRAFNPVLETILSRPPTEN